MSGRGRRTEREPVSGKRVGVPGQSGGMPAEVSGVNRGATAPTLTEVRALKLQAERTKDPQDVLAFNRARIAYANAQNVSGGSA